MLCVLPDKELYQLNTVKFYIMENKIKETTEQLKNGTITKDEADKILLGITSVCEHDYMRRGGPAVYYFRCKCGKTKM